MFCGQVKDVRMTMLFAVTILWLSLMLCETMVTRQRIDGVRLVGGPNEREGRLEVRSHGIWGTVCDDDFDMRAASVVCNSLGFPSNMSNYTSRSLFGVADFPTPILLDNVRCYGNESTLNDCEHNPVGENNCYHREDISVTCVLVTIEAVRLVGGQSEREGRLEVMTQGVWGTVCDDHFDRNAANVACRSLGFPSHVSNRVSTNFFGAIDSDTPIHLDNTECWGHESSLNDCEHHPIGKHNCAHNEDVGIICGQRLNRTITEVRLVNGSHPTEGRLEVLVNGTWGTVCDDRFSEEAASVACRMLGFQHIGATVFHRARFGHGNGPIHLEINNCAGHETQLDNCIFDIDHGCPHHREDVGIRCGLVIDQVRLVDGSIPQEGRLEVMVNGTWGSVCDDMIFDRTAQVVCQMLGFSTYDAKVLRSAPFGPGTGPIHLDMLNCQGDEDHLDKCEFNRENNCHHIEDVGIRCGLPKKRKWPVAQMFRTHFHHQIQSNSPSTSWPTLRSTRRPMRPRRPHIGPGWI